MPDTKNALIRYKYLDDLLSDRHHYYSKREIWEKCCEKLVDNGYKDITLRCIQEDIKFLEYALFYANLESIIRHWSILCESCVHAFHDK